jgi:uncharacterized protein involved in oxidation of intracellular sulfur
MPTVAAATTMRARMPDHPQPPLTARSRPTTGCGSPAPWPSATARPFGDAVASAAGGQKLRDSYYHLDRMPTAAARDCAEIRLCGSCLDARAIDESRLAEGARRSGLDELTDWTLWAD